MKIININMTDYKFNPIHANVNYVYDIINNVSSGNTLPYLDGGENIRKKIELSAKENYTDNKNDATKFVSGRLQFSYKVKKNQTINKEQQPSTWKVNIKSKKMYMNLARGTSSSESSINSTSNYTSPQDQQLSDVTVERRDFLITRQFLKNSQRRTTLFTTASPGKTSRAKSRVSRDNRRALQASEREILHQEKTRLNFNDRLRRPIPTSINTNAHIPLSANDGVQESKHSKTSQTFTQHYSTRSKMQSYPSPRLPISEINQTFRGKLQEHNTNTRTLFSQHSRQSKHYPSLPIIQPLQQNMKPKQDMVSQLHQTGGRVQLSGSSSSPVEPIKPLLQLGGRGGGVLPQHPVFDDAAPRNLSGLAGSAAYLHCVVHNLANRSVSIENILIFVQYTILLLLFIEMHNYTSDPI